MDTIVKFFYARSRLVLVIFVAVVGLLFWLSTNTTGDATFARIRREGVIRIGYAVESPYIYPASNGKLAGMEYETGQAIAAQLGIKKVEWVKSDVANLVTDLNAGRFDMISVGVLLSADMARQVSFSDPLFRVRQALLVRSGNPLGLHSYEDAVKNPKVKIAVLRGPIEDQMFAQLGLPASRIIGVPDVGTGKTAIESGRVDGLVLSQPTARNLSMRNNLGRTEVATPFVQTELENSAQSGYGGAAFRPSDNSLRRAWNDQLGKYRGSPAHIFVLKKYGFSEADLPGN
ncbi:MAG TPA: ectoine/hydroxyectoine ABC transporter substrate-binding protein EhuB [Anaerolineales bacterium]|jgi:polar amino acid transport system substrate-binding protein